MNRIKRIIGLTTMMFSLLALSVPASAADAAMTDVSGSLSGPYGVQSTCVATGGVGLTLNTVTYEVAATAEATSTRPAAAVGTAVRCEVYNTATGQVYGVVAAGLPGAAAAAASPVTFPRLAPVDLRVCGSAVYSDGGDYSDC